MHDGAYRRFPVGREGDLAGAQRVQQVGCKNANANQRKERNNNIHDATLTNGVSLGTALFPNYVVRSESGFVRPDRPTTLARDPNPHQRPS